MTDVNRTPSREGKKLDEMSGIVEDRPTASIISSSYRISMDVIPSGKYLNVGGESFEKIISINCHFTTTSFKRS